MAYSTQKDFFYVPYMNESMEEDGEGSNVKMKSYEAAMDERSWAMDDQKKSNFLHDLVSGFTVVSACIYASLNFLRQLSIIHAILYITSSKGRGEQMEPAVEV